jgi:peptide/nickel transport system substrate-binding protein
MGFAATAWKHQMRRFVSLGLVGLLLTAVLSSCSPKLFRSQSTPTNQLIISTTTDVKTFNYAMNAQSPNVFTFTYAGLIDEEGTKGEIVPELAESWQISPDRKTLKVKLRPDLKWSDGQPLTSDDVMFTFQDVYFNDEIPTTARDGFKVGEKQLLPKLNKIDDRTVDFVLPEPFAPFIRSLNAPILPKHALLESVKTKDRDGKPKFLSTWDTKTPPQEVITNGPYTIESYVPGQRIIYRRNPNYWRKDEKGKPTPHIEQIVWQILDNSDARMLRFRSGELDMSGLRPEDFALLKQEEKRGKFTIYNGGPSSGTTFISFNMNKAIDSKGNPFVDPIKSKWFNNKSFRQAVAYALDRRRIIDQIFRGVGDLQDSPISVQSSYYFGREKGLKVYDHNPAKAKELLKSSGFKYNDQGALIDSDGHRVEFSLLLPAGSKNGQAMATQMQQNLKPLGIKLNLDPVDFNVLVEKINARRWDMYFLSYTGGVEPNNGANMWLSNGSSHDFNQGPRPGQPPIKNWQVNDWEKRIDQLMIAGAREFDEKKRQAIYAEFQQLIQEEVPVIHLVNPIALTAIRNKVTGVKFSGLDTRGALWNLPELKVEE